MSEKWYVIDKGSRQGEKIVARYNDDGSVHTVASAFLSRDGWMYRLYPVSYRYMYSIRSPLKVSIYNVVEQGDKNVSI